MTATLMKVVLSASIIAFSSWLAGRKPALAGFILALPISSLLALAFTHAQFQDAAKTVTFARSIFLSVPLSLTFFVPFLFADRLRFSFWGLYFSGIALLAVSFGVHRVISRE